MSIDAVGSRSVTPDSRNEELQNAKSETGAREFDLQGMRMMSPTSQMG